MAALLDKIRRWGKPAPVLCDIGNSVLTSNPVQYRCPRCGKVWGWFGRPECEAG